MNNSSGILCCALYALILGAAMHTAASYAQGISTSSTVMQTTATLNVTSGVSVLDSASSVTVDYAATLTAAEMSFVARCSAAIKGTQYCCSQLMISAGNPEITSEYYQANLQCWRNLSMYFQGTVWTQPSARFNSMSVYMENACREFQNAAFRIDGKALQDANHFMNQALVELYKISPSLVVNNGLFVVHSWQSAPSNVPQPKNEEELRSVAMRFSQDLELSTIRVKATMQAYAEKLESRARTRKLNGTYRSLGLRRRIDIESILPETQSLVESLNELYVLLDKFRRVQIPDSIVVSLDLREKYVRVAAWAEKAQDCISQIAQAAREEDEAGMLVALKRLEQYSNELSNL